ncbi:MAG: hypothetical protein VX812_00725 [Pseudomonadota bacterium]|nr:hypothetical protein [Pseudomonadota bacterium]
MNKFKPITIPLLLIFIALSLWTIYWYSGSLYIKNKIYSLDNVSYQEIKIEGYPFYFEIGIDELEYGNIKPLLIKKLNLKTLAWRFDQIGIATDKDILINLSNSIFVNLLPKILTINYQKVDKEKINLNLNGKELNFSDNLQKISFSVDKMLGNIEIDKDSKVNLIIYKSKSTLEIRGKLSKDTKDFIKGKLEFSFSEPNDIKKIFQIFGIRIDENPITNLLIYRGKIDLVFEDGITFLGPLPIGRAPKLD